MQYWQRKLQRSVTEMRRYSIVRPNWSVSVRRHRRSCVHARRIHPRALAVDVVLALPDRDALLERFDDVALRVQRRRATRVGGGDRHARLADDQRADAMLDRDVGARKRVTGFARDRQQLALRPSAGTPRSRCRSRRARRCVRAPCRGRARWRRRPGARRARRARPHRSAIRTMARVHRHRRGPSRRAHAAQPPATGGMTATSSPWLIATSPPDPYAG